jgi:hypothetical protein
MNSFKKIALAMVAAMTLGTLVSTPASANTLSVVATTWKADRTVSGVLTPDYDTPATAGTAVGTAIARAVPEDNKIDKEDVVRFVATVAAGTSVTASATNATIVSALHSDAAPVSSASGSASLTIATGTGTTATFFVYTKTTAIGTVVFTNGVNTTTFYVQGTVGKIHTLSVTAPASAAAGTKQDVVVTAVDTFGNKVSAKEITATVFANTGTLDTATVSTGDTLATFGQATFKVTLPATGSTRTLITFAPKTAGDAVSATAIAGLATPVLAPFAEIAIRDMAAELAAANAALAAEKAAAATAKAAADKALADALAKAAADAAAAKATADAAAVTAAADLVKANAEIAKLKADAVTAKVAADKALADAQAAAKVELDAVKAANAKAIADLKAAFNKLARQWNKSNPKARVALVK